MEALLYVYVIAQAFLFAWHPFPISNFSLQVVLHEKAVEQPAGVCQG